MSNFAIDGLISQFDTTELIEAMLDIQVRGPVKQVESNITRETEKLAAFQTLNANLLSLSITSQALQSTAVFEAKNVNSSNENVVSASVSSSADVGSFSIEVDNLAKADQTSSYIFSSASDERGYKGQFIVNGKTITTDLTDSLTTIATQINGANAGVKASVLQIAPNQNKLVLSATSTGVDKIELRDVGTSDILSHLGLITGDPTDVSFDYTVNANSNGAISNTIDELTAAPSGYPLTFTNDTFTVTDAGGQDTISVTLDGAMTLQEIADAINTASAGSQDLIHASVSDDERLVISSDTGIPTRFSDPDNALFNLGVLGGIQSEEFSSTVTSIGKLLHLDTTGTSTIQLGDGDGSDFIDVDIDLENDNLQEIVSAINEQAGIAGSDITANVITVDNMSRIELNSASGHVQITSDDDRILQTLGLADRQFQNYDQKGENSQFRYNGATVNRSSNVISDLVDGVTLALSSESTSPVHISVTEDLSNVSSTIDNFITSFNTTLSYINEVTLYDPEGDNGILFGNAVVRELESSLVGSISRSIPNLPGVKISELNDGTGIDLGKISITDRSGATGEVDLSGVETVQDVLYAINHAENINVRAEVNVGGQSINIIDESGGVNALKIEEVDGGTTASDLGIKSYIYSNQISGRVIHNGGSSSLSSIGISLSTDGTLTFDSSTLQQMLNEDPEKVKNMLTASSVGFASYFSNLMNDYTAFGTGRMDMTTQAIQDKIEVYNDQIERYEDRASAMETVLRKQFTAMEVALSESQQLSEYLTQQLSGSS